VSGEDIPAALRDFPDVAPKRRLSLLVLGIGGVLVCGLLAVISGFLFAWTTPKKNLVSQPSPTNATPANSQNNNTDQVLGHLAYTEAPESELAPISADGRQRLRKVAAQKYQ